MLTKTFDLRRGDRVRITLPDGYSCEGSVLSADHWGPDAGWYIEVRKDRKNQFGSDYGYYKEGCDGGKVEKL